MELNDPVGKFGNQLSHFSIKFHTLLGKSSKMLILLLLAYYNFHKSRPIGQNNFFHPIVASHMSYRRGDMQMGLAEGTCRGDMHTGHAGGTCRWDMPCLISRVSHIGK